MSRNYKWFALALLWVAFFLQQGTRQIFSATLPAIRGAFHVSSTEIGAVGTVFTLVYGICVPFAGLAADLLRRKWMVAAGVLVFCSGVCAAGFASSVPLLLLAYGVLNGLGQTFYYPSATSLVGQLHRETRATALSLLQLALYFGIIGCTWASGWMSEGGADAWRLPFRLFGGLGVLWALVLALALKDTPPAAPAPAADASKAPAPSGDAARPPAAAPARASVRDALRAILSKPSALLLALGFGMMTYVDVGFKVWMPDDLSSRPAFAESFDALARALPGVRGLPALFAVLWHYLGAVLGVLVGSRVSDRLAARRPGIRMEMNVLGLLGAVPFIILMARTDSLPVCCVALALFGLFRGVYDSNLLASLFDVVPPRYHASAAGLFLCCGFVFGSSSSTVLGWMKESLSLQTGLASLAAFYLVGALVILLARLRFLARDREMS